MASPRCTTPAPTATIQAPRAGSTHANRAPSRPAETLSKMTTATRYTSMNDPCRAKALRVFWI